MKIDADRLRKFIAARDEAHTLWHAAQSVLQDASMKLMELESHKQRMKNDGYLAHDEEMASVPKFLTTEGRADLDARKNMWISHDKKIQSASELVEKLRSEVNSKSEKFATASSFAMRCVNHARNMGELPDDLKNWGLN